MSHGADNAAANKYMPDVRALYEQWRQGSPAARMDSVDAAAGAARRKTCPQCRPKYQDYLRADEGLCWRCGRTDLVEA